jgi:hypothetical protein
MQDITVKVGQRINYTIPIEGSPLPTAKWTINGTPLLQDGRADLSTTEHETVLDIPFSIRSDSGVYSLTLKNEIGHCTAFANVTVLGLFCCTVLSKCVLLSIFLFF